MKATTKTQIKPFGKTLVVAGIMAAIATPVAAKSPSSNYNSNYSNSSYDYAQVVGVTPVVETYRVNNPVEQCWDERVQTSRQANSHTPEILGGLIGAVIGHQVGRGRGQDIATAAGVVLGASVGHDVERKNNRNNGGGYQVVQRCEVRDSYSVQ